MRVIIYGLPALMMAILAGCSERQGPPAPVVYGRAGSSAPTMGRVTDVPVVEVEPAASLPSAPKPKLKVEKLTASQSIHDVPQEAFPEPKGATQGVSAKTQSKPEPAESALPAQTAGRGQEPKKDRKRFDLLLDSLADEKAVAPEEKLVAPTEKQAAQQATPKTGGAPAAKVNSKPQKQQAPLMEEVEEDVPDLTATEAEAPRHETPLQKKEKTAAPARLEEQPQPTDTPAAPVSEAGPAESSEPGSGQPTFIWPTTGVITAHFNHDKGRLKNDGINIKAVKGTPVVAAESGVVAYAANELQGFGNLVIIKHPGGWMTTYGHNEKLLVKAGQKVAKGQQIASVGASGNTPEPRLHFEIRKDKKPVNPEDYLP
ncbi:MAG: peptidoglycan DD-metalloendopeptidase family protein [Holosporales bacterium]